MSRPLVTWLRRMEPRRVLRRAQRALSIWQTPLAQVRIVEGDATRAAVEGLASFDGRRAFQLLEKQCENGPRAPGTAGHRATSALLLRELGRYVDCLAVQEWAQPIRIGVGAGSRPQMRNIFGLVRGVDEVHVAAEDIRPDLMLCAHWDTRPVADEDPNPDRRRLPVPGANDGASGVAVLLELARVLQVVRPPHSLLFAFWDGEDLGEYYYGSRVYARRIRRHPDDRWVPRRAILLDMIGGRDLRCRNELNSVVCAPGLWDEVHAAVRALRLDHHFHGPVRQVTDDHVNLNRAGIPAVVLIDYSYPHWHTTADTVDKCSAESLQVIGDVVLRVVHPSPRSRPATEDRSIDHRESSVR